MTADNGEKRATSTQELERRRRAAYRGGGDPPRFAGDLAGLDNGDHPILHLGLLDQPMEAQAGRIPWKYTHRVLTADRPDA